MRARPFLDEPECVLECLRMLIHYFGEGSKVRAIPSRALRRACRLLKLMATWESDRTVTWTRSREWRSRLVLAGLDPDTLEIVDQYKWDLAWEQLTRTRTFRDDIQRKWIAMGKVVPKAESYIRALQLPESKKDRSPQVKSTISDYMSSDLKARLRGRNTKK